jgi:hypothetical protein
MMSHCTNSVGKKGDKPDFRAKNAEKAIENRTGGDYLPTAHVLVPFLSTGAGWDWMAIGRRKTFSRGGAGSAEVRIEFDFASLRDSA